jgi:hypothetical protein
MIYYYLAVVGSDPTDHLVKETKKAGKDAHADATAVTCYCEVCKSGISDRAKHCGRCNRCVDKFDHHCPYVNNCIGG